MVLTSRAYFQSMNMQQTYKRVLFNISLVTASEGYNCYAEIEIKY